MQDPQSLEYQILQQGDFPPPPADEHGSPAYYRPATADDDNDGLHSPRGDDYAPGAAGQQPAPVAGKRTSGRPKGSGTVRGTAKEKKDRQRVQNRQAAERSRLKKRDELYAVVLSNTTLIAAPQDVARTDRAEYPGREPSAESAAAIAARVSEPEPGC